MKWANSASHAPKFTIFWEFFEFFFIFCPYIIQLELVYVNHIRRIRLKWSRVILTVFLKITVEYHKFCPISIFSNVHLVPGELIFGLGHIRIK